MAPMATRGQCLKSMWSFHQSPLEGGWAGTRDRCRLSLMEEVKIVIRAEFWGRRRESQAKFSREDENITYQKEQARASSTG